MGNSSLARRASRPDRRASLRLIDVDGEHAVIVAVRAVHVMQMARHEVVDVIAVRNGFVATARSVMVFAVMPIAAVIRGTIVRILFAHTHSVFLEMTVMREMQMPVM